MLRAALARAACARLDRRVCGGGSRSRLIPGSVQRMPTLEHHGLVDMFRENPALAPHLLDLLFQVALPRHASVCVADSALDQLVPVEFRADLVLELRDEGNHVVFAIILEVQRAQDRRKRFTWPAYVAVARAKHECPTVLLVVAPEPDVAGWAAERIDLGMERGALHPFVIGQATVPVVTDPAAAVADVELATLSAVTHGNGREGRAVLLAALAGLGRLDQEHAAVYFQIIWDVLREPMQRALEELVMVRQSEGNVEYPPFLQRVFQQGEEEGELRGRRDALLELIAGAGLVFTEEERARVESCEDSAVLTRWTRNVLGAKTAADVFA